MDSVPKAMPYDSAVLQDAVQALDDAPSFSVDCGLGLPCSITDGRPAGAIGRPPLVRYLA